MYQEWTDNSGVRRKARIDAPILRFVELIGEDETAKLLLHFGGAPSYFSRRPEKNNSLLKVISRDSLEKLAIHFGHGHVGARIPSLPLGIYFLVRHMYTKGVSMCEIARRLHITANSVRVILKSSRTSQNRAGPDTRKKYQGIFQRCDQ